MIDLNYEGGKLPANRIRKYLQGPVLDSERLQRVLRELVEEELDNALHGIADHISLLCRYVGIAAKVEITLGETSVKIRFLEEAKGSEE